VIVLAVAVVVIVGVGWWGSGRPRSAAELRPVAAGVIAAAVVGSGFVIAVGLRVAELRDHPITQRYGTLATVVVTPTETPHAVAGGRVMFRGSLLDLDGHEISGSVVVFSRSAGFADVTAGRPASFRARIGRPTRRDLTVAVLSATGEPKLGEASAIDRAAHQIRRDFGEAARAALAADQAAMLPALVLGDTSTLSAQTTQDFRASGLTHLTAVSGANVTIVCGTVLLSAALVGPRVAVILAGFALLAFVIVVQPSASVLRAAVMATITLAAVLSHRRRQALPVLSATVIVLMIASPELAVDVGFALSVSATAALVVIAPVWSQRLVARGYPKPLADALGVAVAAQLVTAPLVAGMSGRLSLVSVAANLAVAAVIPPITVVGTAAAVLGQLWPSAAQLMIRFTGPELWWLLRVARWAAAVPGATVSVPSGVTGVALVAIGGVAAAVSWRWRWVRLGAAGVAVCLLAWTLSAVSGGHDTIGV
jgi:competence protein ComEC